jgi:hypothetical protein
MRTTTARFSARVACVHVRTPFARSQKSLDSTTVDRQFLETATLAFVRSGLVVVIALGVLAAAASASPAVVVSGTVVLDPAQPVCRVGHPCTKPLAHFKLVFWRHGRVAARVVTDSTGRYRVTLSPAIYGVTTPSRPQSGLRPRRITVPRLSHATRNFRYDAGIR